MFIQINSSKNKRTVSGRQNKVLRTNEISKQYKNKRIIKGNKHQLYNYGSSSIIKRELNKIALYSENIFTYICYHKNLVDNKKKIQEIHIAKILTRKNGSMPYF